MQENIEKIRIKKRLQLIEAATDSADDGITISDALRPDNPIIYANRGFERLTGYSIDDIQGKNCRFLQGPHSDPDTVTVIAKAIEKGQQCTVELLNYRKNGTPFWNRLSITPIRDHTGQITNYVGIQSDITELKYSKEKLEAANRKLHRFKMGITRELEQARNAQRFLLPRNLPHTDTIRFAAKFTPMAEIGGDFYDVVELQKNRYGVVVGDVTGHGIPAALLSFMSSISFKKSAPAHSSPRKLLQTINGILHGEMHDDNFVAMFYAVYDHDSKVLKYSQAGTPPGLLIRPDSREVIPLATRSFVIGVFPEVNITEKQVSLRAPDKVLLFTDAVTEASSADGRFLGSGDLELFIKKHCTLPIDQLVARIYDYGLAFSGRQHYQDDFTLVGFEVTS